MGSSLWSLEVDSVIMCPLLREESLSLLENEHSGQQNMYYLQYVN